LTYQSTKTFPFAFSAAFRQHKADSHCRFIHGYALSVRLVFQSEELDVRNWVVDFGSLKDLKGRIEELFDHTTIIAEDDPGLDWFVEADRLGLIQLRIFPAGGCERFAEYIFGITQQWLADSGYSPRVKLISVEVSEHPGNSAIHLAEDSHVE
jgi:6-pyruvoyltetrahydropterin/6-carboxytetrahydropterin synthase